MKQTTMNAVRELYINQLFEHFKEIEDVGMITSGSFNFPITNGDEEGWVEIVVKVPKYADDEGYELRNDYNAKIAEKEEKAKKRAEEKAKKIERDKLEREKKRLERLANK